MFTCHHRHTPPATLEAWDRAFTLLSMEPPCRAFDLVSAGAHAAVNDDAQLDAWISLGNCMSRILESECGKAN